MRELPLDRTVSWDDALCTELEETGKETLGIFTFG
jgi:hypothetical protein